MALVTWDKIPWEELAFPTVVWALAHLPDLGIRKTLPLNKAVTIDLPAQPAGKELRFTCPMNMLKGTAVAK